MATAWEEEAEVMRRIGLAVPFIASYGLSFAYDRPAPAGTADGELEALFRHELELADILLKPKPSGTAA